MGPTEKNTEATDSQEDEEVEFFVCPNCVDTIYVEKSHERPNHQQKRIKPDDAMMNYHIKNDKKAFQVDVDVQNFGPKEISVEAVKGTIYIEGQHDEMKKERNCTSQFSRRFKRRFDLPADCDPKSAEYRLSYDGTLSVRASKISRTCERGEEERITNSKTAKRKVEDEEPSEDDDEDEEKVPKKKNKS